jgi:hypothetical protein
LERIEEYPREERDGLLLQIWIWSRGDGMCYPNSPIQGEHRVVKAKKRKPNRKPYTSADLKLLRQHSKARTPVAKIAKSMKRSEGSLRQKALKLGIGLGHQR